MAGGGGKELTVLMVGRMESNKTGWSCPWNSDQNCTQNSVRGCSGVESRGFGSRVS